MKFCSHCNEHFKDNYIFCPNCKQPLTDSVDISSRSTKSKKASRDEQEFIELHQQTKKSSVAKAKKQDIHGKATSRSRRLKIARRIIITFLCFILVFSGAVFGYVKYYLGLVERDDLFNTIDNTELGITDDTHSDDEVINIALFGTDSRQDDDTGRADAQMILTVDKKNNKIKLTSIARDTKVTVDGYGTQKITNAWRFGAMSKKENVTGSSLAVKTLNKSFNLDIKDYVEVNFFQFAEIIDYLGGVELDVDEDELKVINKTYIPYIKEMGIECEPVKKTGLQVLSGGQALAYSRNRYTGDDVTRGGRQREVIIAIYEKFKDTSISKYPGIISMILPNCMTSLSDSELLSIASWAALSKPTVEQLSLPTKELKAYGQTINGSWFYVYDLDKASEIMHNFIYEDAEETTSSEATSK